MAAGMMAALSRYWRPRRGPHGADPAGARWAEPGRPFPASGSVARRGRGAPGSAWWALPPLLASEQISEGVVLPPINRPELAGCPRPTLPGMSPPLRFLFFTRFYPPGGSVGSSLSKLRLPGLPWSFPSPARGQEALSRLGPAASPGIRKSLRISAINLFINCE